jgi:hypothetical protein
LEAEIRRIEVRGQLEQIVCETPSTKQPEQNGLEVWLKSKTLSSNSSATNEEQTNKKQEELDS